MEKPPKTMAAEILHHGAALGFGKLLNGMANITRRIAGLDGSNAKHKRVICNLGQPFSAAVNLAHRIHAGRIAVPAINNDGDVNIDNIAIFKGLGIGNTVANHMIDRGADRVLIAAIAKTGGQGAIIHDKFKSGFIQRRCAPVSYTHLTLPTIYSV